MGETNLFLPSTMMTTEGYGDFVSSLLRPISSAREQGNLPLLVLASLVTIFTTSTVVKALNAVWVRD